MGYLSHDPRIESTFLTYWKSYAGVGKGEKPKEEPIASARDTVYAYPYFTYTIGGEEKPAGWKKPKLYVGRIPYEKLADPASPKAEELYAMIADTATATPAEKGYLKGLLSLLENATKSHLPIQSHGPISRNRGILSRVVITVIRI